jgi:hypothetical protein
MVRRSVRKPLRAKRLSTGYIAVQGAIELEIRTREHRFEALEFIVDSGSNLTTIPVSVAKKYRLSLPARSIPLKIRTAAGSVARQVFAGQITARIPGLPGRDFTWPCHFVAGPVNESGHLLGLSGIVNDLRLIFEGTYSEDAPYGWLILEELAARSGPV